MRKLLSIFFFMFVVLSGFNVIGQANEEVFRAAFDTVYPPDTVSVTRTYWLTPEETLITTDTVVTAQSGFTTDTAITQKFRPDAMKATWWGAVIPGMGQIMNRRYWKLPIVYGGFMGCAFAITYYSERYNAYKFAYKDIIDNDPTTNSFLELLPENRRNNYNVSQVTSQLRNGQDNYRRYRDLSIFITIAYYGLTILEAYVDAQLHDFDISPDLSMRVQPAIINNDLCNIGRHNINQYSYSPPSTFLGKENAIGVQLTFTIK